MEQGNKRKPRSKGKEKEVTELLRGVSFGEVSSPQPAAPLVQGEEDVEIPLKNNRRTSLLSERTVSQVITQQLSLSNSRRNLFERTATRSVNRNANITPPVPTMDLAPGMTTLDEVLTEIPTRQNDIDQVNFQTRAPLPTLPVRFFGGTDVVPLPTVGPAPIQPVPRMLRPMINPSHFEGTKEEDARHWMRKYKTVAAINKWNDVKK